MLNKGIADMKESDVALPTLASGAKRKNVIVCWDFDFSLINGNSDYFVQDKLYDGDDKYTKEIAPAMKAEAAKQGTTVFTDFQDLYGWPKVFKDFNLNAQSFARLVSDIPVFEENVQIVKGIDRQASSNLDGVNQCRVQQYIISNANEVLIDNILKKHKLYGTVFKDDQIFTNPGWYDATSGVLRCQRYHNVELGDGQLANAHTCDICDANLCKGKVLKEEVMCRHNRLFNYDNVVIYVGDGGNDLCPVRSLKAGDYAFVRKFKECSGLEAKIEADGGSLKCNVLKWKDGKELLQNFQKVLPELQF
eukprot:CAMPEP_0202685474 /NCGR_PEP_ID=MMETSP1385-20130828/1238_1 /ASSEMBLY_ACC=CAM_ASM_000861 /TAXON_ID=933848 /ORGANISM="Elphidium margaritaceum" /LENGTH=305 /DNA_ID=CAMNT_0049339831 /DNA_START=107 /DNA_END=1024 /DNA_ORIENTATION=-